MKRKNLGEILLVGLVVLILSGLAAFFSIFGLTKLYVSPLMYFVAGGIEFGKLVAVTIIYRHWKDIKKFWWSWYLVFATVIVMFLTSLGIYGFLTSIYQKTMTKVEYRDGQIKLADNKKTLFVNQLDRINKSIESDNNRINILSNVRGSQERRIDTLYQRKLNSDARNAQKYIGDQNDQLKVLNQDMTERMKQASVANDSIAFYDQKILTLKSSDVSNEIGPFKYISEFTGISLNKMVNILSLIILFVFDPLAIGFLLVFNYLLMNNKMEEKEKEEEEKEEEEKEEEEKEEEEKEEEEKEEEEKEEIKEAEIIPTKIEEIQEEITIPEEIKEEEVVPVKEEVVPAEIQEEITIPEEIKEEEVVPVKEEVVPAEIKEAEIVEILTPVVEEEILIDIMLSGDTKSNGTWTVLYPKNPKGTFENAHNPYTRYIGATKGVFYAFEWKPEVVVPEVVVPEVVVPEVVVPEVQEPVSETKKLTEIEEFLGYFSKNDDAKDTNNYNEFEPKQVGRVNVAHFIPRN